MRDDACVDCLRLINTHLRLTLQGAPVNIGEGHGLFAAAKMMPRGMPTLAHR
jgi:hypothetical protein